MAERFTGFWEATGRDDDGVYREEVLTTIGPWPLEEILERLRERLETVPAGTNVRIDLIAWADE